MKDKMNEYDHMRMPNFFIPFKGIVNENGFKVLMVIPM